MTRVLSVANLPVTNGRQCYHCFSVGNTIDECAEYEGKPWSDEFLATQEEIEEDTPPTIQ